MQAIKLKILTLLILISSISASAGIITQEKGSTHLRWNIFSPKDLISIQKKESKVYLKTLNTELYRKLEKAIKDFDPDRKYINSVTTIGPTDMSNASKVVIDLNSSDVELFSFYKDRDKKLVIDFWREETNRAPVASVQKAPVVKPKKKVKKKITPKVVTKKKTIKPAIVVKDSKYRDFRYGASFLWDYSPVAPKLKKIINLERKTPEYFFEIKNRDVSKGEDEAHMQLSINLFRKKKWGLMYKSIKLYGKKYGLTKNADINEYMKANAILRENFAKGNYKPVKMSISMFENIVQISGNYELRRGLYKYLIPYYIQANDHIKALELTKKYYVDSKENYDYEESNYAAEGILYSLANLKQIEKVQELLREKTIQKILPKQVMLAYEIFTYLSLEQSDEVIKLYEKRKAGLVKPVHPVILYNVAESYFRNSQYKKAAKTYDEFLKDNSFNTKSSHARLRIAQSWEIQGRDFKETENLYKNAINRSQDSKVGYEARIRYVALRNLRKKNVTDADREIKVFLQSGMDTAKLDKNLKKLLWLVRLRTFIVEDNYDEALAYLNALPLKAMVPTDRRVFESDGAEVAYGLIRLNFKSGEYANVIKAWEIYRDRFISKVANDPQMNFFVANAYMKLGLFDGFDKLYEKLSKSELEVSKTFPIWVKREGFANNKSLLAELQVIRNIKMKNWSLVKKDIALIEKHKLGVKKLEFYKGIVAHSTGKWKDGAKAFEKFLASGNEKSVTDPKEVAELIKSYTDCLYELGDTNKYQRVANALLRDSENIKKKNPYMDSVREKVSYLNIELLAGEETDKSFLLMEAKINKFKDEFKKSIYMGRINYLLGLSLLNNKKDAEGKKVFEELIGQEGVDEHIKDLARSELSMLKIKERTL
jgi:TolA-binding protein